MRIADRGLKSPVLWHDTTGMVFMKDKQERNFFKLLPYMRCISPSRHCNRRPHGDLRRGGTG